MCHVSPIQSFACNVSVFVGPFSLPQCRIHVYPRAYVVVAQEAGLGGQSIVGENRVVIR